MHGHINIKLCDILNYTLTLVPVGPCIFLSSLFSNTYNFCSIPKKIKQQNYLHISICNLFSNAPSKSYYNRIKAKFCFYTHAHTDR
jgi:hypothetical protein